MTDITTSNLGQLITNAFQVQSSYESAGKSVGKNMETVEDTYLALLATADGKPVVDENGVAVMDASGQHQLVNDEATRQSYQVLYQRAARSFESAQTLFKNMFDSMREAIRNMRLG